MYEYQGEKLKSWVIFVIFHIDFFDMRKIKIKVDEACDFIPIENNIYSAENKSCQLLFYSVYRGSSTT